MSVYPQVWVTDEVQPRELLVRGRSGVDPDVFVAYATGQRRALWIIEHSGHVIDLKDPANGNEVKAKLKGT